MGAFVGTINKIEEVPELERLVYAYVKNFKSLVPRDTLHVGDLVVFIEPDSVLPDAEWAETYKKYAPKRVKPIKLRGFLTEGIIILLRKYDGGVPAEAIIDPNTVVEDQDVSAELGITHYEPPIPTEKGAVGQLPVWLPKTDEVRWEHLPLDAIVGKSRNVTLKIDGSSCTFVLHREDPLTIRIFSRSLEYKDDGSTRYSRVLDKILPCEISLRNEILDAADEWFQDELVEAVVYRGELYGDNIQKRGQNPHATSPLGWKCFGAYIFAENTLHKLWFPSEFCATSNATIEGEIMDVDEGFINGVMEGAGLAFAPEMYEGVVIHFPPYIHKGREYTSCKVINKAYDALV